MKRVLIFFGLLILFYPLMAQEETGGTLVDDLKTIIDNQKTLEEKISRIINSPGVKINGKFKFSTTDVLFMGPGTVSPLNLTTTPETIRYRPMIQYLDLDFNSRISKEISLSGIFRFENVLGGSWGYYNVYGSRRLYVKGNTDYIDFYIGDYQGKLTSFTLMPVEEKWLRDFESDIFALRRQDNKNELYLIDDSWPLSGISLSKDIDIVEKTFGIGYNIYGAYIGRAGGYNIKVYDPVYDTFIPNIFKHNQFMYSLSPKVKIMEALTIKGDYLKIFDAKDSGTLSAPAIDNTVMSGQGKIDIGGILSIYGEYAMSSFDPGFDPAGTTKTSYDLITGTAMKVEGQLNLDYIFAFLPKVAIKGGYLSVSPDYIAYGAQTRIYDAKRNNQFILTQNNTWNPQSVGDTPQGYEIVGGVYPFTRYNNTIVTNMYLSYNLNEELAFPYGEATQNRQGPYVIANIDILDKNKIYGFYSMTSEIKKTEYQETTYTASVKVKERDFTVMGGGAKIVLFDILELKGGAKMEGVENGSSLYPASLNLMEIDGGVKLTVLGSVDLLGGIKQQTWKGKELSNLAGKLNIDGGVTYYGAGAKYNFAKDSYILVNYSLANYVDNKVEINNFNAQEIDVNLVASF